ncbi:DUF4397 domain-containing protein [Miniimonas arenae]|uniref:DUF4397 domain-containing protein n=1 Tax=Miniimonas arenae TaxID=676201 RepID=UPI0028AA4590|nr:DUF4397 domain-containing protein [Miniimonas arenae]
MRHRTISAVALASLAALALPAAAQAAPADTASLSVLHGVPDTTVDVWVNGALTIDDFTPGTLAGPLELAPGTYSVAITAADATDASSPVIGPVDLPLEAGTSYTAVAHLTEAGTPTATLFTNDTSATPAGQGRLTVRHVAAAPTVDIWANGSVAAPGLAPGAEASLVLPAGTIQAAVSAAGSTDPVLGPADVTISDGTLTVVYAWGSLENGTLALATQTVAAGHSAPGGVPTGEVEVVDATFPAAPVIGPLAVLGLGVALLARRARPQR